MQRNTYKICLSSYVNISHVHITFNKGLVLLVRIFNYTLRPWVIHECICQKSVVEARNNKQQAATSRTALNSMHWYWYLKMYVINFQATGSPAFSTCQESKPFQSTVMHHFKEKIFCSILNQLSNFGWSLYILWSLCRDCVRIWALWGPQRHVYKSSTGGCANNLIIFHGCCWFEHVVDMNWEDFRGIWIIVISHLLLSVQEKLTRIPWIYSYLACMSLNTHVFGLFGGCDLHDHYTPYNFQTWNVEFTQHNLCKQPASKSKKVCCQRITMCSQYIY